MSKSFNLKVVIDNLNVKLQPPFYELSHDNSPQCNKILGPVEQEDQCRRIMTEAGLSESFPQGVARSIQSITVEDIRDYFEQDVTKENGIPTGRFPMPATIDLAIANVVALRFKFENKLRRKED